MEENKEYITREELAEISKLMNKRYDKIIEDICKEIKALKKDNEELKEFNKNLVAQLRPSNLAGRCK